MTILTSAQLKDIANKTSHWQEIPWDKLTADLEVTRTVNNQWRWLLQERERQYNLSRQLVLSGEGDIEELCMIADDLVALYIVRDCQERCEAILSIIEDTKLPRQSKFTRFLRNIFNRRQR